VDEPTIRRAVLDTNTWLDWLVFDDPAIAPLHDAQTAGRLAIFIDARCEAELARVLAYDLGKHSLSPAAQAACLERCRAMVSFIATGNNSTVPLPTCRDPDDQKFLECALAAGADYLITKDRALLELDRHKTRPVPFRILTPDDYESLQQ
jgi:putative PIN family toxin of toxin-antitoxin system